jgi:HSP20 family protein
MLIRHNPFTVLNEINKLFDDKLKFSEKDDSAVESGNWLPAVDIREEPNQFLLYVDVPGVKPEKIEISMENNILTIKGERDDIQKEEKKNYHRVERIRGSFYRRFALPDTADANNIQAKTKHGILEIVINKKKIPESKKIQIQVEE